MQYSPTSIFRSTRPVSARLLDLSLQVCMEGYLYAIRGLPSVGGQCCAGDNVFILRRRNSSSLPLTSHTLFLFILSLLDQFPYFSVLDRAPSPARDNVHNRVLLNQEPDHKAHSYIHTTYTSKQPLTSPSKRSIRTPSPALSRLHRLTSRNKSLRMALHALGPTSAVTLRNRALPRPHRSPALVSPPPTFIPLPHALGPLRAKSRDLSQYQRVP